MAYLTPAPSREVPKAVVSRHPCSSRRRFVCRPSSGVSWSTPTILVGERKLPLRAAAHLAASLAWENLKQEIVVIPIDGRSIEKTEDLKKVKLPEPVECSRMSP